MVEAEKGEIVDINYIYSFVSKESGDSPLSTLIHLDVRLTVVKYINMI